MPAVYRDLSFCRLATRRSDGLLVASPKGEPAGFVHAYNSKTLVIPDRLGNLRIDGFENLLVNPEVGIIFYGFWLHIARSRHRSHRPWLCFARKALCEWQASEPPDCGHSGRSLHLLCQSYGQITHLGPKGLPRLFGRTISRRSYGHTWKTGRDQ